MNLRNLGRSISSVIIKRGQDYLLSGHVESVRELKPGLYRAKVAGTELYEVFVQLGEQDEVLSSSCTCPYDMDAVCKHQAAVLMYLRDHKTEDAIPNAIESASARPTTAFLSLFPALWLRNTYRKNPVWIELPSMWTVKSLFSRKGYI